MAARKPMNKNANKSNAIPLTPNRNFSVNEAAASLSINAITIWRAIWGGHLQTYRIGRRHVISTEQLLAWLEAGGKTTLPTQPLAMAA